MLFGRIKTVILGQTRRSASGRPATRAAQHPESAVLDSNNYFIIIPDGLISVSYCCFTFVIRKPFMTKNAKQMIPAYGCLVVINTTTASIDKATPVMSRCLFQTGLLKLAMITPQIPFMIVMAIITINTVFTQKLIPVNPNRDTVTEEPDPFPNAGINNSIARRIPLP